MQIKIKRSRENLRDWFKLYDSNNDDFLELDDIKKILKVMNISVRDQDIDKVFELIDLQQTGKISYNTFCDVFDKDETLPVEKIVRKRREDRGEAYILGLDQEEQKEDDNKNFM